MARLGLHFCLFGLIMLPLAAGFSISPAGLDATLLPGGNRNTQLLSAAELAIVGHDCRTVMLSLTENELQLDAPRFAAASEERCGIDVADKSRLSVSYRLPLHVRIESTLVANVSVLYDLTSIRVRNTGNGTGRVWVCDREMLALEPSEEKSFPGAGLVRIARDEECEDILFEREYAAAPVAKKQAPRLATRTTWHYAAGGVLLVLLASGLYLARRLRAFLKDAG